MLFRRNPAGPPAGTWATRVAAHSARRPWRAIAGWLVFVILCLAVGSLLGTHNATTEDYRVGEAGRAEALAAEGGIPRQPTEHVLITARSGALDPARATAAATDVAARMRALPEVAGVSRPVRAHDGSAVALAVRMNSAELDAKEHVGALTAVTARAGADHRDLRVEETGDATIGLGLDAQRGSDLALSEMLTLPVTLVTLLVVFGSVLMAGVPLLLALTSIAASMGLAMIASHVLPDAGVGNNVILLIGMAVGVDYALFYTKREREERARAGGTLDAETLVGLAARTSGRVIVVSGVAVAASSATLFLAGDVIFSSLATGTIIVVLVAVASSLTVLPALLTVIGRRTARRAARRAARGRAPKRPAAGPGRIARAVLRPADRHPVITLAVSLIVLTALALPALGMHLRVLNKDSHSRDVAAMRTYDRLTTAFPDLRVRHQVVVRTGPAEAGAARAALRDLARRAQADPLFAHGTRPAVRTSADHRTSSLELAVPYKQSSDPARRSLDRLRRAYVPATVGRVAGADVAVTGDVARDTDYLTHQDARLPVVVVMLLVLTFALTVYAFRSVVIALVGAVLNVLSAAAAFGVLVVFFQWGLAELFGVDPRATGAIGSRVPLFLFVILFGLSMDYQMFVVGRISELVRGGTPARQAVRDGIAASAKVVTSAATVMVTVFASFTFLHLAEMKQIGFCLAVGVLLDAFVIRTMLLPAALALLGRHAWWPRRVRADQRVPLPELSR